ncbi:DUF645 family protein [Vibrio cholerae]|nr:DUF645 family protein [Vibrio cholerae]
MLYTENLFHKGCIIAESVLSLSRILNRGQG